MTCRALVQSQVEEEFYLPCAAKAPYEIRGMPLCAAHYIEALEHSAHLDFGQWDGDKMERYYLPPILPPGV